MDFNDEKDYIMRIIKEIYQYVSEKDKDFLAAHNYSKEEALDEIKRLAQQQGYGQITSLLMET